MGNYPFTTIEPNQGIGHVTIDCPCKKYGVKCKPHFGSCTDGLRRVPIRLLDVAGLIPGAHEGLGLGNKFLDDLRKADVLIHVIDISGTTNHKGETTTGYDPSNDHEWLLLELTMWISKNLWGRWSNIARRHQAVKATLAETMTGQLSGYGAKPELISQVCVDFGVKEPVDLTTWEESQVESFTRAFINRRFPFVLALNKSDTSGDSDANAVKLLEKYGPQAVLTHERTADGKVVEKLIDRGIMCSALGEVFLRRLKAAKMANYVEGTCMVDTAADFATEEDAAAEGLKPIDEKTLGRVEKLRDMVLFRLGSTGVQKVLNCAMALLNVIPVYPIKHNRNFSADKDGQGAFAEVLLVKEGTTVREFAKMLHDELDRNFHGAEDVTGRMLAEDDCLTKENNVVRILTNKSERFEK
eukprot:GDKJ01037130.1.p1 GENE.GDKJ01037130.1~~GDKJ01037130.1.p1  ORF type:complete len:431 (-),score=93.56 GDKJ01037130.1:48-1286(-)